MQTMALPPREQRGRPALDEGPEIESRKLAFLAALPSLGVTAAAREAGVAEFTPCKWYANDAKFRAAWDALEPLTARRLEAIADAVVNGERELNSSAAQILMFRLKGLRPSVYRERSSVEHTGANGGPIAIENGEASRGAMMLAEWSAAMLPAPLPAIEAKAEGDE